MALRRWPVWTEEEEKAAGARLVAARAVRKRALKRFERVHAVSPASREAASRKHALSEASRDVAQIEAEFVNRNIRLVLSSAAKAARRLPGDLEDMAQRAMIGLMRAAKKFDPERGYRFSTYAIWWIRQSLTRSSQEETLIRRPVYLEDQEKRIRRAQIEESARSGRSLDDAGLSERTGLSSLRVRRTLGDGRSAAVLSLDMPTSHEQEGTTLQSFLAAPEETSQLEVATFDLHRATAVRALIAGLGECREADVIRWRFYEDLTLDQIGKRLGVSRERVRQIESKVLRRLAQRAKWSRALRDDVAEMERAEKDAASSRGAAKIGT